MGCFDTAKVLNQSTVGKLSKHHLPPGTFPDP
jgi:hypothetical protein